MSFLQISGLRKQYLGVVAVDTIDLAVSRGEFISLLGPSGCGKTTTLQMIAGFIEPTKGEIHLDGRDLGSVRASRRGLGVVFQSYALFPHMTVEENVGFGLDMRRVSGSEKARRVAETLDLVQLGTMRHRLPSQLSGGQRQRVALARALVIAPPILLLDEPLSNLDAKLREDMQIELRRIQRSVGTTTIMVTHDQSEAMALSDRIAVMNFGRIEQMGTPYQVYENPVSPFVSKFLGKTNLLRGQVRSGGSTSRSQRILAVGQATISLPELDLLQDEEIDVSLRPEKIRVGPPEDGVSSPMLRGCVRLRIFCGDHWVYEIDTPAGSLLARRQNEGPPASEGEMVGLHWNPSDLKVVRFAHVG